mgnify:CR=1 FL=1
MLAFRVNVNIMVFAEDHEEAMDVVYDELDMMGLQFEIIESRQALLVDTDEEAHEAAAQRADEEDDD